MNELCDLLVAGAKEYGINLSKTQIHQFILYKDILLDYNKKINLTAITDEKEIILKHFIDCLSLVKFYSFKGDEKVIDIGSGAGFPAIPLKIALPNIKLTIVDSLNKRINFLKHIATELVLENTECLHARAEILGHDEVYREKYDVCTSRAVAYLPMLSEFCIPFVKKDGYFLAMKGPTNIEGEIQDSNKIILELGAKYIEFLQYAIPFTDINHNIVFIKKTNQTSHQYPRDMAKIKKSVK